MTAAALIRESLGRVVPQARQVTVDAVVHGFASQLAGLEALPPTTEEALLRRLHKVLLWGDFALEGSTCDGYEEVESAVAGVLSGLVKVVSRGD